MKESEHGGERRQGNGIMPPSRKAKLDDLLSLPTLDRIP